MTLNEVKGLMLLEMIPTIGIERWGKALLYLKSALTYTGTDYKICLLYMNNPNGQSTYKYYSTWEEGFEAFIHLWEEAEYDAQRSKGVNAS